MMVAIFWGSVVLLLYVYAGYFLLLQLAVALKRATTRQVSPHTVADELPDVSVIIAAHNEERVIGQRIENLLASGYPLDKLEIIVASDGSTDATIAESRQVNNHRVRVFNFERRGKALTHNRAVEKAKGEIIIFTDAEGSFDPSFILQTVECFRDPSVGCVTGNLFFQSEGDTISHSLDLYWELEKRVFGLESDLGILAAASGTCMAARKTLWRPLASTDDADFCTPLDVVLQDYRVVFAKAAVAYDVPWTSLKGEFKSRIRMTSQAFFGILARWGLRGWIRHPLVSFGLLSHKFLRWVSPFFMLSVFASNIYLLKQGSFWKLVFVLQLVFYATALVGGLGERLRVRIPIASTIFSFCVANLGMALGVFKGMMGRAPASF